jgi:citrate lyase subunit beta/citryl-CoA lyase
MYRTLLFVPGNRQRMLQKARTSGADALVIDLEDAVPAKEKAAARKLAREAVRVAAQADGPPTWVRVNNVHTALTRADLSAVVQPGLRGVVHPKTDRPQDLRDLDVLLREAEVRNKVRPGDVAVIPLIETPAAIIDLARITKAIDRVVAVSLGGEDYCTALGVVRSDEALAYARGVIVTTAAALGISAIDTPYPSMDDSRGLAQESKLAAAMGFAGKYVIHPDQIAAVQKAFSPSREEIAWAERVVAAAMKAEKSGRGAVSLDGKMIDAPIVARARRVLGL